MQRSTKDKMCGPCMVARGVMVHVCICMMGSIAARFACTVVTRLTRTCNRRTSRWHNLDDRSERQRFGDGRKGGTDATHNETTASSCR